MSNFSPTKDFGSPKLKKSQFSVMEKIKNSPLLNRKKTDWTVPCPSTYWITDAHLTSLDNVLMLSLERRSRRLEDKKTLQRYGIKASLETTVKPVETDLKTQTNDSVDSPVDQVILVNRKFSTVKNSKT